MRWAVWDKDPSGLTSFTKSAKAVTWGDTPGRWLSSSILVGGAGKLEVGEASTWERRSASFFCPSKISLNTELS
jgi:hypothetical protein